MTSKAGLRIKAIRLSNQMTQTEFGKLIAEKLGTKPIAKGTVNNWEHNRNIPNTKRLNAIATLGNVSVDYLLNGVPQRELADDNNVDEIVKNTTITDPNDFFISNIHEMYNFQRSGEIEYNEKLQEMINKILSPENIEKLNEEQSGLIFAFMKLLTTLFISNNKNDPMLNDDLSSIYFHADILIREIDKALTKKIKNDTLITDNQKETLKENLEDLENDINQLNKDY